MLLPQVSNGCIKMFRVYESVVVIIFLNIFYLKIYQIIFLKKKIIFDISASK